MIGFIDTRPKVERRNGLFFLTLDDQQFVLTRHALAALGAGCRRAELEAEASQQEAQLIPFPKKQRRRP